MIKFTLFKYAVQWLLVHSPSHITITTVYKTLYPVSSHSQFTLQPHIYFCPYGFIYSGHFISVESHNTWSVGTGFIQPACFHGTAVL